MTETTTSACDILEIGNLFDSLACIGIQTTIPNIGQIACLISLTETDRDWLAVAILNLLKVYWNYSENKTALLRISKHIKPCDKGNKKNMNFLRFEIQNFEGYFWTSKLITLEIHRLLNIYQVHAFLSGGDKFGANDWISTNDRMVCFFIV